MRPFAIGLFALAAAAGIAGCASADGSFSIGIGDDAGDEATGPLGDAATRDADGTDATIHADAGPCPDTMALVHAEAGIVCVDLYEGAIRRRERDGGESPWPYYEPLDDRDASDFRAVPARGIEPQGYISAVQAEAACKASGKRLCTADEWLAACRGEADNVYPYGDTYEAGACNEGKPSPIVQLFGPNPTYSSAELNDPRCDQIDGGLARGGEYARCVSAYGAFDMHGNLHEWVDDTPVPSDPDRGSFLGGFFVDAKINGAGCGYRTTAHAKTYHDYSTGFRCCADPR
jgi:formylglycine-generating enzyme required for sulfatase activity